MRLNHHALRIGLALAAAASLSGAAHAQSLEEKLRAQLRTVLGQLHDLQNTQATLEAEKAAAEQERDALKAKLGAGGAKAGHAAPASAAGEAELKEARAENARLTQALQQAQAETAKYKDAYASVADSNQQVHAERDRLAQDAATATQQLAACETKNIELVKIGRDVLAAYQKLGVRDALARGEPMIGLKRVRMERIAQDLGDKVYEAKFDARLVKPAPAATPSQGQPPAPTGPAPSAQAPAATSQGTEAARP
jgi:hypothetical protein